MKLYSKDELLRTVISMKRSGRTSHGFLLTGESGSGRTFSAKYIAMSLMCDSPGDDGCPCGECRQCRRIAGGTHPDVIMPEGEGKSGGYSVSYIREKIVADAFTAPNDCSRKVYIIRNSEKLTNIAQDSLLKIVEEPPDHVFFIFTALSRNAFLPTLLSRVITVHTRNCSTEETAEALRDTGNYSEEDIAAAVSAYGGNIGSCTDFLEKGKKYELFTASDAVSRAMLKRDGYTVLKILSSTKNRDEFLALTDMIDRIIRDAAVIKLSGKDNTCFQGCCPSVSEQLSFGLTAGAAMRMHEAIGNARYLCGPTVNSNINAVACVLSAELCGNTA